MSCFLSWKRGLRTKLFDVDADFRHLRRLFGVAGMDLRPCDRSMQRVSVRTTSLAEPSSNLAARTAASGMNRKGRIS